MRSTGKRWFNCLNKAHASRYSLLGFSFILGAPILLSGLMQAGPALSVPRDGGDEIYQPRIGQEGKDVIWVPTPDGMVAEMLKIAAVSPKDLVVDLGSGDGKIVIAAAKDFGARAIGIEYDPDLAALARRNAQRAGVANRVTIIRGDIFKEDFSKASVLTLYLLQELNLKLKPTILAMKPGTRVVSHTFDMGTWRPDANIETFGARGYYWIVPARAQGRWEGRLAGHNEIITINIQQKYQHLSGTISIDGRSRPIQDGRMKGERISFGFSHEDGSTSTVSGVVDGSTLRGELTGPGTTGRLQTTRNP